MFAQVLGCPDLGARIVPIAADMLFLAVIVANGARRGLLLPNLEGVDTVDRQIDISLQKAGIGRFEDYTLERFTVERHT